MSGRRPAALQETVARAMDASDTAILPDLPYILQDSWEIGASSDAVLELVRRHVRKRRRPTVLDLGCGKGPIAVRLAAELGCRCLGLDAIPEFIAFAKGKAREYGVSRSCRFEIGDVREKIAALPRFDVIVLGAIGPVFGNYRDTLNTLAPHLEEKGVVVIDDGYVEEGSDFSDPRILKKRTLLKQIRSAGMVLADEIIASPDAVRETDKKLFAGIERRCRELIALHPEKRTLFEDYIRRQIEEGDILENKIVCSLLAIKRA